MAGMTTRWGALRMFGLAARAALRPGGPSIATRVAAIPRMVRATVRGEYRGASIGTLGLMGLAGRPGAAPQDAPAPAPGATETVRSHVVR